MRSILNRVLEAFTQQKLNSDIQNLMDKMDDLAREINSLRVYVNSELSVVESRIDSAIDCVRSDLEYDISDVRDTADSAHSNCIDLEEKLDNLASELNTVKDDVSEIFLLKD